MSKLTTQQPIKIQNCELAAYLSKSNFDGWGDCMYESKTVNVYEQLAQLSEAKRIELLTRILVRVPSVNGTAGELDIAKVIEGIFRSFPIFQIHPQWVWTQKLPGDKLGRENVFAFLPKPGAHDTVIYHAHFDTVGVADFGSLKTTAFTPDELAAYFQNYSQDADIQKDAQSKDWLFGRGALDMKSGDAVHINNILYFSEHPKEQQGNLLFMGNCVEENDHSGVVNAIPELMRLKMKYQLNYTVAVNTDFISPKYENDTQKYIYYGAAGKVLTCFYIKGEETHVGNTYGGIDSTMVASAINLLVNNNPDLVEAIPNEEILPSSCLMLRDQKDFYNVQTAKTTYMYFNTFTYQRPVYQIMAQMKQAVQARCGQLTRDMDARETNYQRRLNVPQTKQTRHLAVYTYQEYIQHLNHQGIRTSKLIKAFVHEHGDMDKRQIGFELINYLDQAANDTTPKVVLFIAPPFCPHNYVAEDSKIYRDLQAMAAQCGTADQFVLKKFFPFLSDSSYFAISESETEIQKLALNFPLMAQLYPLPYAQIRDLAIPAVDIGVYGKGAHTWKERVYKPYSFGVLPNLIRNFTQLTWAKGV